MLTKEKMNKVTVVEFYALCVMLVIMVISAVVSTRIEAMEENEVTIAIDGGDEFSGEIRSSSAFSSYKGLEEIEIRDEDNGITYHFDLSSRTYEVKEEP